ncbi:hypothetical protein [Actinomyces sp. 565]|uniref:TY-Chap domain-containing protein n=1 Tax=Actinomyces sp. 565 TaxID=2057794 RepID=UPI0013A69F35|nr:hypothetical protein [Actinomyces sp. 565]NDR54435.1 hypothetical protein [Actinomyces sp. 565]
MSTTGPTGAGLPAHPTHTFARPADELASSLDVGSWDRLIPSLAHVLLQCGIADAIVVELTVSAPIVSAQTAARIPADSRFLRALRVRRRPAPSPEPPCLKAFGTSGEVSLGVTLLDQHGRAVLTEAALEALVALGWEQEPEFLGYRLPASKAQEATAMAARVLIEVFGVAHPADLDVHVIA